MSDPIDGGATCKPSASVPPAGELILEPLNILEFDEEELRELVDQLTCVLQAEGHERIAVRYAYDPPIGVANSFSDRLNVFLPDPEFLKDTAWAAVWAAIRGFMKKRHNKPGEARRTRVVDLFDGKGNPIKKVEVPDTDSGEVDRLLDVRRLPPK